MKSRLSPTVRQGYPALAACKALANRLAAAVQHFHVGFCVREADAIAQSATGARELRPSCVRLEDSHDYPPQSVSQ